MKVTYNLTTRELVVIGDDILKFIAIVPESQEEDYWNTVMGLDGNMLYDINLFDYGDGICFQYVNLVDDGRGGLECGDNYKGCDINFLN
jgi:hypothetical protein